MMLLERSNARGGFTLLEILTGTMIFAIVLVAMHTVLFAAFRLENRTTALLERSMPVHHAMAMMKKELRGALVTGGTMGGPIRTLQTGGGSGPGGATGSVQLEFHSTGGVLGLEAPWGNVQRVAYYLAEPWEGSGAEGYDLVRATTRNLLSTHREEAVEERMLSGVWSLQVEFFDGYGWSDSWQETGEAGRQLEAVRVRLEMAETVGGEARRRWYEMVVPVPAANERTGRQGSEGGEA
jgi:type II secretion system protein J